MTKIKIDKNDKERILLTELLPYEVPIIFSNEGFYKFYKDYVKNKDKANYPEIFKVIFEPKSNVTIPFNYKIKKNILKYRTLSIMHPVVQAKFIEFYDKYNSLLLNLCSKSPFSIRYPEKVANYFYMKNNAQSSSENKEYGVEVEQNGFEKELTYASSFFSYKKYNLLLKFYDSYDFLRLEKKYKHLLKFDISNCFNSIYTHSIAWAVKDKDFAKANIKSKSFESKFDELMQNANYNETNGILIGPEISRIFAEIILQRIDANVKSKLENNNIIYKSDYEVKRYVDDYFLFTNDDRHSIAILKEFQEELEYFKMYINESKTEKYEIPFITGITIARNEIQKLISEYFKNYIDFNGSDNKDGNQEQAGQENHKEIKIKYLDLNRIGDISNRFIRDIKCIVKSNNVEYESITSLTFSIFKKKLFKIYNIVDFNKVNNEERKRLVGFLYMTFDVLFFLFSMDYRVRSTYLISQIIIATNKYVKNAEDEIKQNMRKKIYDEAVFLIKNIVNTESELSIEVLNLIIAMKELGEDYLLEPDVLKKITLFESNSNKYTYFDIIVILYYIEDKAQYSGIKNKIEEIIIEKFTNENRPFQKAELVYLFFDIIKCPYISIEIKRKLIGKLYENVERRTAPDNKINQVKNYITENDWFFSWDSEIELNTILLKKELRTPY